MTNTVLREYTEEGYRVIALAHKVLQNCNFVQIPKLRREEVECDLTFAGLVILENRLKDQTTPVIEELQGANMKIIMVTGKVYHEIMKNNFYKLFKITILGDNILTAVSVAKECGIVLPSKTVVDVTADESQGCSPKIYYTASGITSPMVHSRLMFKLLIVSYIIFISIESYIHV